MTTWLPQQWATNLERYLRLLADQPAAAADLRSGLGRQPVECDRMHRWVAGFVPEDLLDTGRERAVYAVASLSSAYRQVGESEKSLGASLAELARNGGHSEAGVTTRLHQLVRAPDSESLVRQLPPTVSAIAASGGDISWAWLAADIDRWDFDRSRVARRWLRDFHHQPDAAPADQPG